MRLPSLIRLARNKRFEIEPRYYDPIKEEIEERTSRIKSELDMKNGKSSDGSYAPGRITFERKTSSVPNTSFLQLLIAAILGGGLVGWLYFGNDIFYALWASVPIYLYFRFKKRAQNS